GAGVGGRTRRRSRLCLRVHDRGARPGVLRTSRVSPCARRGRARRKVGRVRSAAPGAGRRVSQGPAVIVGIDIGGSTTDAVRLDPATRALWDEASDPIAAAAGARGKLVSDSRHRLHDVTAIAATGGGARLLGDELLGVAVRTVPEITAIGLGGSMLAGKEE